MRSVHSDSSTAQCIEEEFRQLKEDRGNLRQIFPSGNSRVCLPVNLKRLIWNATKEFKVNQRAPTDLTPMKVINDVRDLTKRLLVVKGEDHLSKEAQRNATMLFQSKLRSTLCSKKVLEEYRLSSQAFDWLIGEIEARFNAAQVCFYETIFVPSFKFLSVQIVFLCAQAGQFC